MTGEPLADLLAPQPTLSSREVFRGWVWSVREDEVDLGAGGVVRRDLVDHPGAVGVLALDPQDRVLLVRQYRHPVGAVDWEIPAGLLDVVGEEPWVCAERELFEEGDLRARSWRVLLDAWCSPGGSTEAIRIYLARELTEVPVAERHQREAEELDLEHRWVALDEAVQAVLAGRLHNSALALAVLSAVAHRAAGYAELRPVDAPWPEHPSGGVRPG